MALILGLIIIFCIGFGIGVWASHDWFRYRGLSASVSHTDLLSNQILARLMESVPSEPSTDAKGPEPIEIEMSEWPEGEDGR